MKIKICGIKNPDHALFAAQAGADFIGLVFAEQSKRRVDVVQANAITDALQNTSAIPVAVFAEETLEEIVAVCEASGINTVQLHGAVSRASINQLPTYLNVINAVRVAPDGKINVVDLLQAQQRNLGGNYLLFDAETAGSGKTFAWENFHFHSTQKWFLSGGLTPANVIEAIKLLKPNGVDVSSGVERDGEKDPQLIKQFIQTVKNYENHNT